MVLARKREYRGEDGGSFGYRLNHILYDVKK